MGATELRLQIHQPAAGLAAGAVLVSDRARLAVPELPPDPLEVVHLEHEEGDDPEENLGARHCLQRIGTSRAGAMGRAAQPAAPPDLRVRGGAVLGRTATPRSRTDYRRGLGPDP